MLLLHLLLLLLLPPYPSHFPCAAVPTVFCLLLMFLVLQDEVRALGRLPQLNVPEAFISRHPFPGLFLIT